MLHTEEIINRYFYIWAIVLPITSFVLFPSIPGTAPGLLLALFSVPLIFLLALKDRSTRELNVFLGDVFLFLIIFTGINAIAQYALILGMDHGYVIDFSRAVMVSTYDSYDLRTSMFTQSIYFIAAFVTFLFVKTFYRVSWDRYLLIGAVILGSYGIYEFIYFLIFHSNGDFISNRMFFYERPGEIKAKTGSFFQTATIAGQKIMRLKSLTGEPSMYAYTILPLWIYAVHLKKKFVHFFLLITLFLSTSTTAFLGIAIYLLVRFLFLRQRDWYTYSFVLVFVLIIIVNWEMASNLYDFVFGDKLETRSGVVRQRHFENHIAFFADLPLIHQLFGVGFGYIRATNLFITFICNVGIVGFTLYVVLFLVPIIRLSNTNRNIGLKCSLIVILTTGLISVPEFAYLPMWVMLGIAYHALALQRREARVKDYEPVQAKQAVHALEQPL
ncbi:hypothetical protein AB6A23_06745 [Paenibacillus tarimensis]